MKINPNMGMPSQNEILSTLKEVSRQDEHCYLTVLW
jgi:hypothetical protein